MTADCKIRLCADIFIDVKVVNSVKKKKKKSKRDSALFPFVPVVCRGCLRQSAVPNSELAVLTAARLELSGGEIGSGPGNVAVPNGTGLEGGTVK